MAISGIGILESGGTGTIPALPKFKYSGNTTQYQVPYPIAPDINSSFKVSATEEGRASKIIENQLIGISNSMYIGNESFITFDGVFTDKSNHPANNLIVSISGVEAFIKNIFVGGREDEFSWSGLSHGSTNYLWINPIEEPKDKNNYKSSRQFRDFETRATTTTAPPKEDAILVATYVSGVGINQNPTGKVKLTQVKDHTLNNKNPHGTSIRQHTLVVSGLTVQNSTSWEGTINSGKGQVLINNNLYFSNITFPNQLTQYMYFTCSGINGTTLSGSLLGTFFNSNNISSGLSLDPATVGYLDIRSGVASISGSLFRNTMYMVSGAAVDGVDLTAFLPMVAKTSISGNPFKHTHAMNSSTTCAKVIYPKYENSVVDSTTFKGNNYDLEVITDDRNLISSPKNLSMAAPEVIDYTMSGVWLNCGGGSSNVYSDVGPDGTLQPAQVFFNGGANDGIKQYIPTQSSSEKFLTFSVWAKSVSTGNSFRLANINITPPMFPNPAQDNFVSSPNFTATSNWKRFEYRFDIFDTNFGYGIIDGSSPSVHSVEFWGAEISFGWSGALVNQGAIYDVWNYNTSFGLNRPTLQHKSKNSSGSSLNPQDHLYLRTWMPPGYNTLDSIDIQNKVDSGNGAIQLLVRDSLGLARVPAIGSALTSSGVTITTVSGIPQTGFAQNCPFDLEFTFNNLSGLSHYLGGIAFNFKAQRTT